MALDGIITHKQQKVSFQAVCGLLALARALTAATVGWQVQNVIPS